MDIAIKNLKFFCSIDSKGFLDRENRAEYFQRLTEEHNCFFCEIEVRRSKGINFHDTRSYDHITPRCNGGKSYRNLVVACALCNNCRGTENFVEFAIFARYNIKPYRNDLEEMRRRFLRNAKKYIRQIKHINNHILQEHMRR